MCAYEVVHEVKSKKESCLIFKVDFERIYDSMCWDFSYYKDLNSTGSG